MLFCEFAWTYTIEKPTPLKSPSLTIRKERIEKNKDNSSFNSVINIPYLKKRLKTICEEKSVLRLDLYGSRARLMGTAGSDYDFIAELQDLTPREYSKNFFSLLHALEDELKSPVDLITYNSLKKRSLKENILRERIPIYG